MESEMVWRSATASKWPLLSVAASDSRVAANLRTTRDTAADTVTDFPVAALGRMLGRVPV
jgi:hypothetical protein